MRDWRCVSPMRLPSECCSCADMPLGVTLGFDRGPQACRWWPSVRCWSALRSLWEDEDRRAPEGRRQRAVVAGGGDFRCGRVGVAPPTEDGPHSTPPFRPLLLAHLA